MSRNNQKLIIILCFVVYKVLPYTLSHLILPKTFAIKKPKLKNVSLKKTNGISRGVTANQWWGQTKILVPLPLLSGSEHVSPDQQHTPSLEPSRNTSWAPSQTYWSKTSQVRHRNPCSNKPSRWFWCVLMFDNHCYRPVALNTGFILESPANCIKINSVCAPPPRASDWFHVGLDASISIFKNSPGDAEVYPETRSTPIKARLPLLTGKKCCPN